MARIQALLLSFAIICCLLSCAVCAAAQNVKFFEVKGVKLQYLTAGKGEPVVLIHGLHSSAAMNWQAPGIFGALAKDYQVIALDLPGHGGSDKPEDESAYGLQVVEDVVALLDHLHIPKAHIVGYSAGGMITMALMAKHPDRVRSAVVAGMGWLREGSAQQKFWESPSRDRGRVPVEFANGLARLALDEAEVKKIKVPAEVIVGSRDPVKRLYVEPLRRVRPDWPVVEIPEAGHITCVAKADFREAIESWLDKQR